MNENLRDALDRAAGQDPHVDLTQHVWAQGRVVRRRRQTTQAFGAVVAAGALVGAVWLGGGLLSDPEAVPGPADPPRDDSAVSTVEVDRTTDGDTDTDTTEDATTEDATTEDTPTGDTTTEDEPTGDATTEAPTLPLDPCTTPYPDLELSGEGLPEQTRDRAEEVLELAAVCDLDGLAEMALQDETHLSFGAVGPQEAFSGEEGEERAAAIATLLALFDPGQDAPDAPYRWPAEMETEQDWTRLVDSGLHTQEEVDLMSGSGIGYTGWRVGFDASGQWAFLVAGD